MQAIVGLGGSAGSIGGAKDFFSHMPGDSGFAFVVVLHLSPAYESRLAGVLQKHTPIPVIQVSGPVKVEANCVYVIPPGKHFLTVKGQLVLNELPHEYGKRTAVDIFFRSLADTHGSRSIAIVLSGVEGDGRDSSLLLDPLDSDGTWPRNRGRRNTKGCRAPQSILGGMTAPQMRVHRFFIFIPFDDLDNLRDEVPSFACGELPLRYSPSLDFVPSLKSNPGRQ